MLKSPYPYFGGKSRVMKYVWARLGDVVNFIDPFAGSGCSLLLRPDDHVAKVETCNDWNCYIANFWRAIQAAPDHVAMYADRAGTATAERTRTKIGSESGFRPTA